MYQPLWSKSLNFSNIFYSSSQNHLYFRWRMRISANRPTRWNNFSGKKRNMENGRNFRRSRRWTSFRLEIAVNQSNILFLGFLDKKRRFEIPPDNTASSLATQNVVLLDESCLTIDINKIIWSKCNIIAKESDNLSDITLTASENSGSLLSSGFFSGMLSDKFQNLYL